MTEDKVSKMIEMYRSGMSLAEVGSHFGRSRQAVHKVFKKRGVETRKGNGGRPKYRRTPEFLAEVSEMYQSGLTIEEICTDVSASPNTIVRALRDAGVEVRKPGNSPLLDFETRQQVIALRDAGETVMTLARRFHVSESTIYKIVGKKEKAK